MSLILPHTHQHAQLDLEQAKHDYLSRKKQAEALHTHIPQTPRELWQYMAIVWNIKIPYRKVCPHHSPPFTAFCSAFFCTHPVVMWRAARKFGGKSYLLASLGLAVQATRGAEIKILGGTGEQSRRVLDYLKIREALAMGQFWDAEFAPKWLKDGDITAHTSYLINGGKLDCLMASEASVRGPHPQLLAIDELDCLKWDLFRSALPQPKDKYNLRTKVMNKSCVVLSSTWQVPDGTMTKAFKMADEKWRNWIVHEWCIGYTCKVTTIQGEKEISELVPGELVLTRQGYRSIQHVTHMGVKPVLSISLSNGRTIQATVDHLFAVPDGWARADSLLPGSVLVNVDLYTSPAVPSVISGVSVGVTITVIMASWAVGSSQLFLHCGAPPDVLQKRDDLEMVGVAASPVAAGMVNCQGVFEGFNCQCVDDPGNEARLAVLPVDLGIPILIESPLPLPAPSGSLNHILPESLHCGDLDIPYSDNTVRASLTPFRSLANLCTAVQAESIHVLEVSPGGADIPVYDIGVEGCHEFVCEGVVVHNCYREVLASHGGWLPDSEVLATQQTTDKYTWDIEFELGEPSMEGRVFDPAAIERAFDPALGVYDGTENETIIIEHPQTERANSGDVSYHTGTDWAKQVDWTVMATFKRGIEDPVTGKVMKEYPDTCVAWGKYGRRPWPMQVEILNQRLRDYHGASAHDATGIGGVLSDYLEVDSEPFIMGGGRARSEFFSAYITAIEHGMIRYPRIKSAYDAHRRTTWADLFGGGHPDDSVVAGALAWHARQFGGVACGMSADESGNSGGNGRSAGGDGEYGEGEFRSFWRGMGATMGRGY